MALTSLPLAINIERNQLLKFNFHYSIYIKYSIAKIENSVSVQFATECKVRKQTNGRKTRIIFVGYKRLGVKMSEVQSGQPHDV